MKTTTIICASLRAAAQAALDKGWFVFGAPYKTKSSYKESHGSLDAVNDEQALLRWDTHPDSNPCIRLDKSGLTVLDVDHGLSNLEEARAWARSNGLPETYVVSTGRPGGGFHFYFRGVRTLPDVVRNPKAKRVGFQLNGVSGDVKCHGHVVAAGGLHKKGPVYVGHGQEIALLPSFIRDYQDPAVVRAVEQQKSRALKRTAGERDVPPVMVSRGQRHSWLLSEAGSLRQRGLGEESIYLALHDLCQFCEGDKSDSELRGIAQFVAAKPCDRRITGTKAGLRVTGPGPSKQSLIANLLIQHFPIGKLIPIQTMLDRIAESYPAAAPSTIKRARKLAGFHETGRNPNDRRETMWVRHGTEGELHF